MFLYLVSYQFIQIMLYLLYTCFSRSRKVEQDGTSVSFICRIWPTGMEDQLSGVRDLYA
jgi:hypothetical protein